MLSVTYYLNPKQVSDQSRVFPQFETINPLGMTITEFHENRIGVDPISDSTAKHGQQHQPSCLARYRLPPFREQDQEQFGELRPHSPVLSRRDSWASTRPHNL